MVFGPNILSRGYWPWISAKVHGCWLRLSGWLWAGLLLGALLPGPGASQVRYWIFLRDKPEALSFRPSDSWLSPEAWMRRLQVGSYPLWSEEDAPLSPHYLQALAALGIRPVVQSRWFNAVSAALTDEQRAAVERLPFVEAVRPVARIAPPDPLEYRPLAPPPPVAFGLEYGPSRAQLALCGVPRLHELGLSGRGVRIGFLDAGFALEGHPAFRALLAEGRLKGQRDFVEGDEDVSNTPTHGTAVVSIAVGFDPGRLIGPAYGAEIVLARTEDVTSETLQEEDFWVAGLEWLEAQGVRLVNSSLGYTTFDGGIGDHTYRDLDGRSTLVTRAANRAAARSVLVINAAGNEGARSWRYVVAPADGDSVLAVGAVQANGLLASFSSRGPTYDGRIKPDVCAMGVGVVLATPNGGYAQGSGTSFAAPIVTGLLALVLERFPTLRPGDLLKLARRSGTRAQEPDNDYGYGVLDGVRLLDQARAFVALPGEGQGPLGKPYPHPFREGVWVPVAVSGPLRAEVFSPLGQRIRILEALGLGSGALLYWDGRTESGMPASAGVYVLRLQFEGRLFCSTLVKIGS